VDALINYISALGFYLEDDELFKKYWPADHHHIGKDILKFHAVIWPALLMSIGIELPEHIVVHGWVMKGEEKLSKSKGITLDPDEMADMYGVDAIRYFFTREISFGLDGSFTEEAMQKRYNADLSNDFGNLVSRSVAMIKKYREGVVPEGNDGDKDLKDRWIKARSSAVDKIRAFNYSECLISIWDFINAANKYIENSKPWELAKSQDEADIKQLDTILYSLAESIRLSTILVFPFMPAASQKVFDQLGIKRDLEDVLLDDYGVWGSYKGGTEIGDREILFPRIEEDK
jgi:methionyl-tRNA synthetase